MQFPATQVKLPDCQENWDAAQKLLTQAQILLGNQTSLTNGHSPHTRVSRSTAQAITTATFTAVSFDTEVFDFGNQWVVGSPTRLTCGLAGCYVIEGGTEWAASAAGNQRLGFISVNGISATLGIYPSGQSAPFTAATASAMSTTAIVRLAVADYVEYVVYQDSGGNLNIAAGNQVFPHLAMAWIGP